MPAKLARSSLRGIETNTPAALLAPLAGKFFGRGMAKNLKALKARLES